MVANHIQRPRSILQATVPARVYNFTIHKPNKGLERQHVLKALHHGLAFKTTAAASPSTDCGDPTDATKPQGCAESRMLAPRTTVHGRDLPMPSTIATDTDPSCLANCTNLKQNGTRREGASFAGAACSSCCSSAALAALCGIAAYASRARPRACGTST